MKKFLKRPAWVCSRAKQMVVLAMDASPSMVGEKGRAAELGSKDLVTNLADPTNKDGFLVAIINFADVARLVHPITRAAECLQTIPALNPGTRDGTNIHSGLECALQTLRQASAEWSEPGVTLLRPVVILFTDGVHNVGPSPDDIARDLTEVADLVCVAYGDDADESLLRKIASTPQHFYRCSNGRELRSFLAAVGATLTATIATGANATVALSQID